MRTVISFLSVATLLTGCINQLPYPETEQPDPHYYVSAVDLAVDTESAAIANQTETLSTDAAKQLRKGITVAFQPPDACVDTSAKMGGGSETDILRMQCGVRMANLERYVAKAGYNVVSWQGLKDATKRPLEKAKSLNVDVLFEVNQLSPGDRVSGAKVSTGLRFYEQTNATDRRELAVDKNLAVRCKNNLDNSISAAQARVPEATITLDTKAVHVKSGRAIWYYQKTLRDASKDEGRSATVEIFYESRPETPTRPGDEPEHNSDQRKGALTMMLAAVPVLVGAAFLGLGTLISTSDVDSGALAPVLQGGGAGIMVFGSGLLLTFGGIRLGKGNKAARKHNDSVSAFSAQSGPSNVEYPSADAVLCATNPVVPPWKAPASATAEGPAQAPATSSTYDFSETAQGSSDAGKRREEALIRLVAQDFVDELNRLTAATSPATGAP